MRFEEQSSKNITEALAPFKVALNRYAGVAWAPAIAVFLLVAVLAAFLPDYYSSDVSIFIQPPKVSSKLIEAPEKEEQQEQFESQIQQTLSRPRLQKVLEQFNPYPRYRGVEGKEKALQKFRKAIEISPIVSPSGKSLMQTFQIQYMHNDPEIAFKVVQALSTLFIEESTVNAYAQTRSTEEFFESQLRNARKALEEIEKKEQQYVEANFGRLPEHHEQAQQQLRSLRDQISQNNQTMSTNIQRVSYLQQEQKLTERETRMEPVPGTADSGDPGANLAQLERALEVLMSKYSDRHPDVVNTKKRIEMLRSRVGGSSGASVGGGSPEVRTIRREVGELEAQNKAIKKQNDELQQLIIKLEADIKDMPTTERDLVAIRRDYENKRKTYEELLKARDSASMNTSLVGAQKNSQFKVVNPPALPILPAGPQRGLIAGVGLLVALMLFFGIPLGFYFVNDSFKFREDVEKELGLEVLGIIPPMKTPAAKVLAQRATSTSFVASAVAFVGGSLLILLVV